MIYTGLTQKDQHMTKTKERGKGKKGEEGGEREEKKRQEGEIEKKSNSVNYETLIV